MTSEASNCAFSVVVLCAAFLLVSGADTAQPREVSGGRLGPERHFSGGPVSTANFESSQSSGKKDAPLPEGKGKELVQKDCTTCHAANVWTKQHNSKQQWNDVVNDMVSKGLDASDEDIETMTDYLTANFGPVKKDPGPSSLGGRLLEHSGCYSLICRRQDFAGVHGLSEKTSRNRENSSAKPTRSQDERLERLFW